MEWQFTAVGLIVTAAAVYLLRSTWRTWAGRGQGCGTACPAGCAAQTRGRGTFVARDHLALRGGRAPSQRRANMPDLPGFSRFVLDAASQNS